MNKILVSIGFLLVFGVSAQAQTRSVTIQFANSPTAGVSGYNAYRVLCSAVTGTTCTQSGTPAKINTALIFSPFTDNSVVAGQKYEYYITAQCPSVGCSPGISGESVPSSKAIANIPPLANQLPGAPPNITITIVSTP